MNSTSMRWWSSGSGRIEFELSLDDAASGYHTGQCDNDIMELRRVPYIKAALDKIPEDTLRGELREWGYDPDELENHDANLDRLLWLACGDIIDRQFDTEE